MCELLLSAVLALPFEAKDGSLMDFFRFLKKRKKVEPKRYDLAGPEVTDLVTDVCSTLRMQFNFLENSVSGVPPIVQERTKDGHPIVDRWLSGYLSGFYDAFSQHRGYAFEFNALELIYCVFYGEEDAAAAVHEYHMARKSLASDKEAAYLFGFDEFEEGMMAGGNNFVAWLQKEIKYPLGIYKKYSSPSSEA
ncbi:hypothetical protein [Pseudomonas fluorescens]|uniref:hypothetical protein n=1 Tax=Pseudomonas fluorescens TaxID=294 RepID=UPI001F4573D0|nr:hypothetical protein [Pseudomonas fluorescens]